MLWIWFYCLWAKSCTTVLDMLELLIVGIWHVYQINCFAGFGSSTSQSPSKGLWMFVGIPIEWHEPLDNAPSIAGWWDLLGDWPAIVSDYLPFDLPVPLWTHDIAGVWRYQQRISALKPRVPTFLSFSTGEPWGEKVREKTGRGKGDRFQIQGRAESNLTCAILLSLMAREKATK